jgi:metal-responsive CopG/Arc/MetJ family transcriptional regulator
MNERFCIPKLPTKLRGDDNHTVVSVRIPNRIIRKIENIIIKSGWNRSQVIIKALDYALERVEIEETVEDDEK